jgi:hypothetical protein
MAERHKRQMPETRKKNQTENESGMIRISAHPEAEKTEEQHHKTPQAHVKFLLELLWHFGCSLTYGD